MTTSQTRTPDLAQPRVLRGASRRAFTLIEVLLVLSLIVLVAGIAAPMLEGTLRGSQLNAAAERLAREWATARLDAIRLGRPVAFRMTLDSAACRVEAQGAGESATVRLPRDFSLDEIVLADLRVAPFGSTIDLAVVADAKQTPAIVFRPDGAACDVEAVLQAEDGRRKRVVLRSLTGAARVEDADPLEGAPAT
ncbi:Type II transport protein GspH [Pseudobythopirellula maris]|uniref:Type II secretion system protein H n=1 Tax=Pseudobythopirellula maris TaxID=2527991 RepID=A0A5C5ZSW0_9BACT|nr:GspH/FimT family pseudopilin [Pseudobythopirellula maris]TWT90148.1 Type II transport protein GspH [Pseudobythopirellula maris]